MDAASRIVVRRPEGGYRDRIRSYWIEVDGVRIGKVARGEQAEFSVAPGKHQVRATIDWSGSPVVEVEVSDGETVRLTVEPGGGSLDGFKQIWKRDTWLKLSVD